MAAINGVDPLDSANVQHKLSFDTRTDAIAITAAGVAGNGIPLCMMAQFAMPLYVQSETVDGSTKKFDTIRREIQFPGYVNNESSSRSILVQPGTSVNVFFIGFAFWNSSVPALAILSNSRATVVEVFPVNSAVPSFTIQAFITIAAI